MPSCICGRSLIERGHGNKHSRVPLVAKGRRNKHHPQTPVEWGEGSLFRGRQGGFGCAELFSYSCTARAIAALQSRPCPSGAASNGQMVCGKGCLYWNAHLTPRMILPCGDGSAVARCCGRLGRFGTFWLPAGALRGIVRVPGADERVVCSRERAPCMC